MGAEGNTLLRLTDLTVDFASQEGTVHAVNRVSFEVAPGELVGLVGESGCGKSVTASAIIGLTRMVPNATVSGQIEFLDKDLLALPEAEVRAVRGRDISMIFQDPVTSLNPVLSIERLMTEGLELHLGMSHSEAVVRSIELLGEVGHPQGRQPHQGLPAPVQRRHAPASDDRHRAELQPQAAAGGRAHDRARRHHPGADPAPAQEALARARGGRHRHHARPRRGRRDVPADPRHVRRPHRGERPGEAALRPSASPVHGRAAEERAPAQRAAARHAADHRRPAAGPGEPAARLRVRAALLPGHGRVLGGRAGALPDGPGTAERLLPLRPADADRRAARDGRARHRSTP